jgi:signal transduction histidine kinase
MRLADFILRDMETILVQWEAFAATLLPAAVDMKSLALRDHAQPILQAVAKDLSTAQTKTAQVEKSLGHAPVHLGASETAAQTHALLRARDGFDINQLAAEYRALRASVLRLWMEECQPDASHPDDVIRFNEAIDQALAESVGYFSSQVDQARNLFLGMLGHDMRSPLQTILMTAQYLTSLNAGGQVSVAASRLIRSGARMQALLNDMLDFNRVRLGLRIGISPTDVDLERLFADELDQLRAAHPDRHVDLDVKGECQGVWDGRRLQQLLGNLVLNAFKYGTPNEPVRVVMTGDEHNVRFEVRNRGPAIDRMTLQQIFDPLQRGLNLGDSYNADGNLGLGLYIAR